MHYSILPNTCMTEWTICTTYITARRLLFIFSTGPFWATFHRYFLSRLFKNFVEPFWAIFLLTALLKQNPGVASFHPGIFHFIVLHHQRRWTIKVSFITLYIK